MELIKLDTSKVGIEISDEIKREAIAANELLHAGEGKGSDFLGWITLPSDIDEAHLAAINAQAAKGYRLHTISTTSSGSKGFLGGDKIQATMVFERLDAFSAE